MKLRVQLDGRSSSGIVSMQTAVQIDVQLEVGETSLRAKLGESLLEADWVELRPGVYSILVDGRSFEAHVEHDKLEPGRYRVNVDGYLFRVKIADPSARHFRSSLIAPAGGRQEIYAPMPGRIARVLVEKGQAVKAGQGLVVIEAMKMQNEIPAPHNGQVSEISVAEGDKVETGEKLLAVGLPES